MLIWWKLITQLQRRGYGTRESGAFLLTTPGSRRINMFICYDALDPKAVDTGIVTVHASGYIKLWKICRERNLTVIADVHTHPGRWTGQSEADRTNPMVAQIGHVALILPYYAQRSKPGLKGAGVYEYLGDHKWKSWSPKSTLIKITFL